MITKKKRIHAISLGVIENALITKIKKKTSHGWFSKYVDRCIQRDFLENPTHKQSTRKALLHQMKQLDQQQKESDVEITKKKTEIAQKLSRLKKTVKKSVKSQ